MLSLVYRKSVPRYLLMRAGATRGTDPAAARARPRAPRVPTAAERVRSRETSRLPPLQLEDAPEPRLPKPEWVRVKPLLSGICGSATGTLPAATSPHPH